METDRFDVVVVGAGLAGLIAGTHTARAGARTLVLDAHRPGGRARTTDRHGFLFNEGPHAVFEHGALMRTLKGWDLQPPGSAPLVAETHALRGGQLHRLPSGPATLASTRLLRAGSKVRFARFMAGLQKLDPTDLAGRTVHEWLELEKLPEDAAALVLLLVRVTSYGNAPALMDAAAAVAQLQCGMKGVRYVDGGWQGIVDSLTSALATAGGTLRTGTPVGAVESDGETVRTHTASGCVESTSAILAGLSPSEADRLLGQGDGWLGDLGPPVEAMCLELGVTRVPTPPVVFGVDRPLYLSTHAPVARLAPPGRAMVELMHYLPPGHAEDVGTDRAELDRLRQLVGIADEDVLEERFLRRMTVAHALPLARAGGLPGRPAVTAPPLANVFLAGDWVGAEGMLSDASAASALSAASEALRAARPAAVR